MSKRLKELMAREIAGRYTEATDCVVINYSGITAIEADDIRLALSRSGGRMEVMRNRVAGRGLRETGLAGAAGLLEGPSALITGVDIAGLCKAVAEWAKEHGKIEVRGGVLSGEVIDTEQVKRLAGIPSIDVLHTQMAGLIMSPMAGIASLLQAISRRLAIALEAIRAKKEKNQ